MIEQAFYSLEDLRVRWTKLSGQEVSIKQIIHLGIQEKILIDVTTLKLQHFQDKSPLLAEHFLDFLIVQSYVYALDDSIASSWPNPISGAKMLSKLGDLSTFETLSVECLVDIECQLKSQYLDSFFMGSLELRRKPDDAEGRRIIVGEIANGGFYAQDIYMDVSCLIVDRENARKYEIENFPSSAKELSKHFPELSETKEQTYLAIIGALLDLMKTSGRANWNQNTINRTMQKCYTLQGLGERKLAEHFGDANKAYKIIFEKSEEAFIELLKENEP